MPDEVNKITNTPPSQPVRNRTNQQRVEDMTDHEQRRQQQREKEEEKHHGGNDPNKGRKLDMDG